MIEVTYKYHCGSDLDVCNAARCSFDKESELNPDGTLKPQDVRLINFLARGLTADDFDKFVTEVAEAGYVWSEIGGTERWNKLQSLLKDWRGTASHDTPFNHCFLSFHVKAPIFVAAQLKKHEYLVWSEVSRRYVSSEPEFYKPEVWRAKAENVKQGSSNISVDLSKVSMSGDGPVHESGWEADLEEAHKDLMNDLILHYEALLKAGVAPEQARFVLPQSLMTEWRWSGSLGAFLKMVSLRTDPHAQYEARIVAEGIKKHLEQLFPVSTKALLNFGMCDL